jgi:hypothetical protein
MIGICLGFLGATTYLGLDLFAWLMATRKRTSI